MILKRLDQGSINRLGGKALHLMELREANLPVPNFFVISDHYFQNHLKSLSEAQNFSVSPSLENARSLRTSIVSTALNPEVLTQLRAAIRENFSPMTILAVRSSAIGEDSANASFAGQMDTFLGCSGEEQVLSAIKKCWASLFSDRAVSYRSSAGISWENLGISVVVQEMVEGEVSGVAFSVNPLTGRQSEMLISATYGLGEGIVSGALDTDQFTIDRRSLSPLAQALVTKDKMICRSESGGTLEKDVPTELQEAASLKEKDLKKLSEMIVRIEDFYQGAPQDIEWTISKGEIFLLQSRPITTLSRLNRESQTQKIENQGFDTIWDNSNIVESYSGVTSPLTFSFASYCYFMVYVQFCEILGVPRAKIQRYEPYFRNMLGLLRGRIYYNLKNWCHLISILPGYEMNRRFMEQMMGVKEAIPFTPLNDAKVGFFRKTFVEVPRVAWTGLLLFYRFIFLDRDVRAFIKEYESTYNKFKNESFEQKTLHEIWSSYEEMENRVLRNWKPPIINDFMAMIFYGLLKGIMTKWAGDTSGSLQNALLSDQGDVESTLPIKRLTEISEFIRAHAQLKELFIKQSPDYLSRHFLKNFQTLNEVDSALQGKLRGYLDDFGFRCMNELKLEEPTLKDRPEFIFSILKNYVVSTLPAKDPHAPKESDLAYQQVCGKLSAPRRIIFKFVLDFCKKAVKVREYQRFARTKMFGLMRNLFRACGRKFFDMGLIDDPKDVFFLTREEIFATIVGTSVTSNLAELVRMRKSEFESYRTESELPERIVTRGAALSKDLKPQAAVSISADGTMKGTSCCPGKVRGRVKVILSPSDDMNLQGEILVAGRTDPGWVTLYPAASGLLIERGSVLSHSAIVARELGLPAIVGIPNITKFLKTGDLIEMDGLEGSVRIIERAASKLKAQA